MIDTYDVFVFDARHNVNLLVGLRDLVDVEEGPAKGNMTGKLRQQTAVLHQKHIGMFVLHVLRTCTGTQIGRGCVVANTINYPKWSPHHNNRLRAITMIPLYLVVG